ncbi:MAG: hypothetical protein RRB13_14300 [bacterium]|nr:hypothetical protein [bacterium]
MTKKIVMTLAGILAATGAFAETSASGNQLFPVVDSSYQANPVLSLVGGSMNPKEGDGGSVVGVELSLDCPLFQPSKGQVRQQVSYTTYDKNNVKITNIELNPHWMTELSDGFFAGFGPGLGLVQTSVTGGNSNSYLALAVGGSASYRSGPIQAGLEYREQFTQEVDRTNVNNNRILFKVGYVF